MKKVVFLLVILLAVTGATFAQGAENIFSAIPAASYTKSDDNAVWTFATTGLTIRDNSGSCTIPIREMKDLAAASEGTLVGFTFGFDTDENKRTYKILYNAFNGSITLNINKNGVAMPQATLAKR